MSSGTAFRNLYATYKRDTQHALFYMINTTNSLLKSLPKDQHNGLSVNTTGRTTLSSLVSMAQLIREHVRPVPDHILWVLKVVIEGRTEAHAAFEAWTADKPDPEMEASNHAHKGFIDSLQKAFEILGGDDWLLSREAQNLSTSDASVQKDFPNRFELISTSRDQNSSDESGSELDAAVQQRATPSNRQRRKRQKKRSPAKKRSGKSTQKERVPKGQVPLGSCHIADHGFAIVEYMSAMYYVTLDLTEIRAQLQDIWCRVAYDGLNCAIAVAVAKVAITMIRERDAYLSAEFPNHHCFNKIWQFMSPSERKTGGVISSLLDRLPGGQYFKDLIIGVDFVESTLNYAYQDLQTFIVDYRQNRNGKPTKRLLSELRRWDPDFDLSEATPIERVRWRRWYTINWLYDLVNSTAAEAFDRGLTKNQLASADWSASGPWQNHCMVFGINDFAGFVTSLAMQNPGAELKKSILPHHVLEMQSIVDSFMACRGWTNELATHSIRAPADFSPRRDEFNFLGRYGQGTTGFLVSTVGFKATCMPGNVAPRQFDHDNRLADLLLAIANNLKSSFGQTKLPERSAIPVKSRFLEDNGLWEYSPYLCGAALLNGLELSYRAGLYMWDRTPEPTLVLHLYNMLMCKGYLRPQSIFQIELLTMIFRGNVFCNGEVPKSKFYDALLSKMKEAGLDKSTWCQQVRPSNSYAHTLASSRNRLFKTKSLVHVLREVDWDVYRVLDEDMPVPSSLGAIHLSQLKALLGVKTAKVGLKDSPLVRRYREADLDVDVVHRSVRWSSALGKAVGKENRDQKGDDTPRKEQDAGQWPNHILEEEGLTCRQLLEVLEGDVNLHLGSMEISYVSMAVYMRTMFKLTQEELKAKRNPAAMDANRPHIQLPNLRLACLALRDQDPECLRVMAKHMMAVGRASVRCCYGDQVNAS
jgi:hypothetical protein